MIPLNYHHLYYFWIVAKAGSITRASRKLYLAQPTLSLQIRQLEKSLGHKLFYRTREGITLTAAGRTALEYCERIFLQGAALKLRLSPDGRGGPVFLRLGVGNAVTREVVLSALDAIDSAGHDATTTISTASTDELIDRLAKHTLEAVVSDVDLSVALGSAFRCRRAGATPIVFVASPELKRRIGSLAAAKIEVPMLLRDPRAALRGKVEDFLRRAKVRYSMVAESENVALIRLLALRGRGVAALSRLAVADDLALRRLRVLPGGPTDAQEDIWIATSSQPHPDPGLRRALEALVSFRVAPAPGRS